MAFSTGNVSEGEAKHICGIDDISDYVLELIFTHVNPYQDFNHVLLVNKRWNRVGKTALARMKRLFYKCTNFSWRLLEEDSNLLSERCSHATCYYPQEHAMFMFGGCTSTYTAFNDLWLFDLSTRFWERIIISRTPLPSAKALASLVLYRDNLILYGGFSKSSTNPIHQTTTFYKEIHLYNKSRNCWEEIVCENTAPHLAGHTASIVGDFMLVFGGSMGSSYNNNVYVLDITRRIWNMPCIPGPCPPPRYGQSQILLDDRHLVIIGGCGGPSVMFCDVWLLDFDLYGDTEWKWTQLKVEGLDLSPPYLWCHRACKVGQNAVVLSRPTKYSIKRSRHRRASSQQSNSASGQRISSPDSPQDRRAVAAAFCGAALPQKSAASRRATSVTADGGGGNPAASSGLAAAAKKKPMLLSSRSLDEQDRRDSQHPSQPSSSLQVDGSNSTSTTPGSGGGGGQSSGCAGGVGGSTTRLSIAKTAELHRACSIPAIIVGEIPKLIVTSSTDHQNQQPKAGSSSGGATAAALPDDKKYKNSSTNYQQHNFPNSSICSSASASQTLFDDFNNSNSLDVSLSGENSDNNFSNSNASNTASGNKYGHTDAVREFYCSLLKEEYDRLKIVELNENLKVEERLSDFLRDRVPYLTAVERAEMIGELLHLNEPDSDSECSFSAGRRCQGRLNSARSRGSAASEVEGTAACGTLSRFSLGSSKNSLDGGAALGGGPSTSAASSSISLRRPSFNDSGTASANSSGVFGQNYYRHMCAYVLRLHDAIGEQTVRWEQLPVEEDSPEDIILYSIIAARGELILFGGMQSDGGNGMDCLNVGMDRHTMNADTFILRPRYNEM